jgi:hypothetical protein
MWLIKTQFGYKLQSWDGTLLKYFAMACDSKAWIMAEGLAPIYLTKKTPKATKDLYTEATGQTLWFDQEEQW